PTFLDLAKIPVPNEMDGRSILPLLKRYGPNSEKTLDGDEEENESFSWRNVFLIESSGRRENPVNSDINTNNNSVLLHNRKLKKNNNNNENNKNGKKYREEYDDNETLRFTTLCELLPHPCVPGQKKYCSKKEDHTIQFKKCRHYDYEYISSFVNASMNFDSQ